MCSALPDSIAISCPTSSAVFYKNTIFNSRQTLSQFCLFPATSSRQLLAIVVESITNAKTDDPPPWWRTGLFSQTIAKLARHPEYFLESILCAILIRDRTSENRLSTLTLSCCYLTSSWRSVRTLSSWRLLTVTTIYLYSCTILTVTT